MRVEEHAEQMRTGEWVQGMQFVAGLSEATKSLLMLFDKATNDSEVIPGGESHTPEFIYVLGEGGGAQ